MTNLDPVIDLIELIRPVLTGHPAPVQGAVLAELLATWLAGHIIPGNPKETARVRARLLRHHVAAVRALTEENARLIHGAANRIQ